MPGSLGGGKLRLEEGTLGVGEAALVCFSHARYPTEQVPQNPFSDSFLRLSEKSRRALKRGYRDQHEAVMRSYSRVAGERSLASLTPLQLSFQTVSPGSTLAITPRNVPRRLYRVG